MLKILLQNCTHITASKHLWQILQTHYAFFIT